MKRILFASAILMFFGIFHANAQRFQLRGLEIYNPYYHNPAFVQAEKTVQLDFIGYNFDYSSGIWASVMTNIPAINSSAGIRFAQNAMGDYADSRNLQLAYAYKHSFSENLHLRGGLLLSSGRVENKEAGYDPDREMWKYRRVGSMGLGITLEYRKLYAGISSTIPLYIRNEVLVGENLTEIRKMDADDYTFNYLMGYSLGKPGRFTFDPIFGLDYYSLNGGTFKEWKGYLGANMEIRNLVGFGFTLGNMVSFSTSLNIMDRVSLMLGVYAGEHDLFDNIDYGSYIIDFNDFKIIAQIRVNL